MKLILLLLALLYLPLDAKAELPKTGFLSFQLENDFFSSHDDQFYTHGTQISFASTEPYQFSVNLETLDNAGQECPAYRDLQGFPAL